MNLYFWQKPKSWPRDPLGYVFFARAFDAVGKAVFGEAWKGVEKLKLVDRLPQSLMGANYPQRRRAHLLLKRHRSDLNRPKPEMVQFAETYKPVYGFSELEWAAAFQLADEAYQRENENAEQLKSVQELIAEACEKKDLALATRNESTGKMAPLDVSIWNAEFEIWGQRFDKCRINPKKPLREGVDGPGYEWIFITIESLKNFLKTVSKQKPTAKNKQTASQKTNCRNWLIEQMQAHLIPPKPKNAYREEAKKMFSVGFRAFDSAWTEAIDFTKRGNWSNPGRKAKS